MGNLNQKLKWIRIGENLFIDMGQNLLSLQQDAGGIIQEIRELQMGICVGLLTRSQSTTDLCSPSLP